MEFTALHGYSDFSRLYDLAVKIASPRLHHDFGKRPLEVLDIQGGNGILGRRLLADGLEGRLSYTNADSDEELLKQTPSNALIKPLFCNTNFLSSKLNSFKFDYIFCLNHDAHVWLPYFADTEDPFSDNYVNLDRIKGLISGIQLLQVASYLRKQGFFIRGGVLTDDNISAFTDFFKKIKSGIVLRTQDTLPLPEETARAFASYDARRSLRCKIVHRDGGIAYENYSEEEIQRMIEGVLEMYKTLKLVSFQKKEEAEDTNVIREELIGWERSLSSFEEHIMALDRFGGF